MATNFHDRFLIIDATVYHLGSSLKDLGKIARTIDDSERAA